MSHDAARAATSRLTSSLYSPCSRCTIGPGSASYDGSDDWVRLVERWLTEQVDGFDPTARFHVGRPVQRGA